MVLWHTDTDVFEPGQWIKGRVDHLTMTSDARYAVIGIMGKTEHITFCRPPYFTALEVWVNALCLSVVGFMEDRLYVDAGWPKGHKIYAGNPCPIERVVNRDGRQTADWQIRRDHDYVIDATSGPARGRDQQGREILMEEGRVYAVKDGEPRLLFDGNQYTFTEVAAPAWARKW
jgi:hypothetical protein